MLISSEKKSLSAFHLQRTSSAKLPTPVQNTPLNHSICLLHYFCLNPLPIKTSTSTEYQVTCNFTLFWGDLMGSQGCSMKFGSVTHCCGILLPFYQISLKVSQIFQEEVVGKEFPHAFTVPRRVLDKLWLLLDFSKLKWFLRQFHILTIHQCAWPLRMLGSLRWIWQRSYPSKVPQVFGNPGGIGNLPVQSDALQLKHCTKGVHEGHREMTPGLLCPGLDIHVSPWHSFEILYVISWDSWSMSRSPISRHHRGWSDLLASQQYHC